LANIGKHRNELGHQKAGVAVPGQQYSGRGAPVVGSSFFPKSGVFRDYSQIWLRGFLTLRSLDPLLDRDALSQAFARIADAFMSRLMSANELPRRLREDLCRELSSWSFALSEVERAQSWFRGGNGQTPEEDDGEN
jgi:hypothetical protein